MRNQFKRLISINSTKSSQPWNLLNVRFEYARGWRSLHIIETFCKNNWATLEVEVVYYYTCMGGSVINTAMDINLPWNEASDRLMHIGLWIRIVRQLYESTVPPNKPKQTFLLHWKISKITHYNICFPPEKKCAFYAIGLKTIWKWNNGQHTNIANPRYWPHLPAITGLSEQLLLQISASIVQFQNAIDHFPSRTSNVEGPTRQIIIQNLHRVGFNNLDFIYG